MRKNIISNFYYILFKLALWFFDKRLLLSILWYVIISLLINRNIVHASHSDTEEILTEWIEYTLGVPIENMTWDDNPKRTLYELMNGPVDPNDTSDDFSSSESEPEMNLLEKFPPLVLFDQFKMQVKNPQIVKEAIEFMHIKFPPEFWAQTSEELKNEQSLINQFQDKFTSEIMIKNKEDFEFYVCFRAAITTYNSASLLNILDNEEIVKKVYFATINTITKRVSDDAIQ